MRAYELEVGQLVEARKANKPVLGRIEKVDEGYVVRLEDGELKRFKHEGVAYIPSLSEIEEKCAAFREEWANPASREVRYIVDRMSEMFNRTRQLGARHWKWCSIYGKKPLEEGTFRLIVKEKGCLQSKRVQFASAWRENGEVRLAQLAVDIDPDFVCDLVDCESLGE